MNSQKDNLWSAAIDGDTAPDQDTAPERLEGERRIEEALVKSLAIEQPCPEDLWWQVQTRIRQSESTRTSASARRRPLWTRLAMATSALAAALFLIAIGYALLTPPDQDIAFLHMAEASVEELAATSAVPPNDHQAAQGFLANHDIRLTLDALGSFSDGHHKTRLIGARGLSFRGDTVVELLFDCCGYPVKIVIAHTGGPAAGALCFPQKEGCQVQVVQVIAEYQVAVVGKHEARTLLDRIHALWSGAMAASFSGAV